MDKNKNIYGVSHRVTDEIRSLIIELYESDKKRSAAQISYILYRDYRIDLASQTVREVIKKYYGENWIKRELKPRKKKEAMSKEEMRRGLLEHLRMGRTPSVVYEISKENGIDISEELLKYGFNIEEYERIKSEERSEELKDDGER